MNYRRSSLNAFGYSLIETMVGVVISCIVAFALLEVLRNHQKATLSTQRSLEFQDTTNILGMYLASKDTCQKLFMNTKINFPLQVLAVPKALSGVDFISIDHLIYDGSSLAQVGVAKNGLKPSRIGFNKAYKAFTDSANNFFVFDFVFQIEKIGDVYGSTVKDKIYQLYFKTNLDGRIASCGTTNASDEGICILSGKVYNTSSVPFCK